MINKRTKIICTIGPASESASIIKKMTRAGMNVARLNFSHGTHESHSAVIKNIRTTEKELGEPIAIMQDLQGPKIRVGLLPEKGINLSPGEIINLDTSLVGYASGSVPIDYNELHKFVNKGERMLFEDGKIETRIIRISGTVINVEVVVGGILKSHTGINAPDSKLKVRALTEKDKADVYFGVKNEVDFIAASFVTDANDLLDLRYLVKECEKGLKSRAGQLIRIIAKIERHEAVKNIARILEAADGIMIARGDLGVEIPAQDVPLVQKRLIDLALASCKPVIVATQMLDSMQNNIRPTRAEVSDVANAVIDHADAVMLSNETATGKYPVETVKTMSQIIKQTEASAYDDLVLKEYKDGKKSVDEVVSQLSRLIAEKVGARLILAASISGETARLISRYRPELPIMVATSDKRVQHQINLSWGVIPFILPACHSIEELMERSIVYLREKKRVKTGDKIIVVAGEPVGQAGNVNLLEVKEVK